MSEHPPARPDVDKAPASVAESVLRSLDRLDRLPVEQHVTVFAEAHERLRAHLDGQVLDDPGIPDGSGSSGQP